ncbi:inositol 2-dehydrogenase [Propionivibrio sp.]|uniref:inositol 2-dehydrogenase n=1 Tax=Propionivibrio sp. TaxID=2212460 RepID=UPI0039E5C297
MAIRMAVIGAGRIGQIHAANAARNPAVALAGIADALPEPAEKLAGALGARVVTVEEIFADPSVDAVLIGSSTDTHADLIQRTARAGKHIFCEKPVDLDLARARECEQAVKASGKACLIGFQRRFDPTFSALKARLDQGEIGALEALSVISRDPGAPPVDYLRRSGGIFKDMLIHDFDIFRWILGEEAETVYATASALTDPAIASEANDADTTAVTLRTVGGKLAQIHTSRRAAYGYDQRFEVLGSKGMLQAGNHRPTEVVASGPDVVSVDKPEHFFLQRYEKAYRIELDHFVAVLGGREKLRVSIEDGVKALELADAATTSWRENRIVRLR